MKFKINDRVRVVRGIDQGGGFFISNFGREGTVVSLTEMERDAFDVLVDFGDGTDAGFSDDLELLLEPAPPASGDRVLEQAAVKHAKPRFDLVFSFGEALMHIAGVLTFGAEKYDTDSWKRPPFTKDNYLAAAGRHAARIGEGELRDPESGKLHAAHFATDAAMYLWHVVTELPSADRTRY